MNLKRSWAIALICAALGVAFTVTECKGGLKGFILDGAEEEAAATVKIETARTDNEIRLQRFYDEMHKQRVELARLGLVPKDDGAPWWVWFVAALVGLAALILGVLLGASRSNQARQVQPQVADISRDYILIPRDKLYQIEGRQ
jgi:hypothetical protein